MAKILGMSYNVLTEDVEREFVDLIHRHVKGADDAVKARWKAEKSAAYKKYGKDKTKEP